MCLWNARYAYHRDGAAQGAEALGGARVDKVRDGCEVGLGCDVSVSWVVLREREHVQDLEAYEQSR